MKILILVMSCEVGEYPQLVKKQQDTWDSINHPEVKTVYYYSSYKTELSGNRLNLDIPEGHGYFYNKTMIAFERMLMENWDYIFKTDNSAYINKEELVKLLKDKPKEKYYGGHLYQTTYVKTDPFLWGEGMVFSRDVAQYLVREYKASHIRRSGVEDVHIGMVLKDKFPWDISLSIPEYYKLKSIPLSHVYRCKDDQTGNEDSALVAMDSIHDFLHPHRSI